MKKTKAKPIAGIPWQQYPEAFRTRSGAKVGWQYYRTKEEAEECSKAARHNAEVQRGFGYDFGWCIPGSITRIPDDAPEYAGLWEVCIP